VQSELEYMKNYINENINTEIKWSRENVRKPKNKKRPLGKITGLYILDKGTYCGGINLCENGTLEIWTDGKYQFIKKEIVEKLVVELLNRLT